METNGASGQTGHFSWDFRDVGSCWTNTNTVSTTSNMSTTISTTATTTNHYNNNNFPLFYNAQHIQNNYQNHHLGGGVGGGLHVHQDPHLTCLKLGKRHYFEDGNGTATGNFDVQLLGERHVVGKRGRSYDGGGGPGSSSSSSTTTTVVGLGANGVVPRCQVEGCHVPLLNAKDYHRRHKVCELHSKAPKVVVLGSEQRFCQQCSRFHAIAEFDDSKRSCRRRLAGHNERRRKSANDSISRNLSQDHRSVSGRLPCMSSSTGRALSLLSSKTTSWVSPSDLSSRSSAALRELIAENRAAILARQLLLDQGWHHHHSMDDLMSSVTAQPIHTNHHHHHQVFPEASDWERFREDGAHVTLDLMQDSSSPFGFLSGRTKSKEEEEEEECCEIWKSLEGTHVV